MKFKEILNLQNEDRDTTGDADKNNFTEQDADPKELKMGIEVEMEHTNDKSIAVEIALDHLSEIKDYYTKLKNGNK